MKEISGKMEIKPANFLIIAFVCLIVMPLLTASDARATAFVEKVQGTGRVSTAILTSDGSYVSISTSGDTSCIVRKMSNSGKRIWERRLSFQVAEGGFVFISGIAQTNLGYVLVGWGRLGGYYNTAAAVMVKLKNDGTVRWSKTFLPPALASEIVFHSVSSTADGGFIVRGNIFQPTATILMKFTASGNVLWSKSFFEELSSSRSQPVSGGLILAYPFDPFGPESTNLRVLKVSESGSIVWKETLETKGLHLQTLGPASDNGVVLAGKSSNSDKLILISLNANGELQWKASYSLKVPDFVISSLAQTSDGGYVITGTKFNPKTNGNRGGIVLRINAKRKLVFQKTFGFTGTQEDAESVFTTAEGGFTIFGSSGDNDTLVLNLNSDGVVPGCGFLHKLSVKKVGSPNVTSKNLEIASEDFLLPAPGTIQVSSVVSGKPSSNACP